MTSVLAIATILIFSTNVQADENTNGSVQFSVSELKDLSPFDDNVQKQVLQDVLEIMGQSLDPEMAVPEIRVSESVSLQETKIVNAAESQGMPGWAFEKGINMYLFDLNIIILGSDMKLHNLAHEYAHYVQYKYKKVGKQEFAFDYLEFEAVEVQRHFKFED